ncbi:hypothetical protein GW17_00016154 [Ensete ventricosum]|nr:hypothetical protein GW17_00016154 [Ensete ventricosum]RZR88358.1 hypothetical protein BHM03_00015921 [Ensete ventricosum]
MGGPRTDKPSDRYISLVPGGTGRYGKPCDLLNLWHVEEIGQCFTLHITYSHWVYDLLALAWHPFHEEYFASGSFDGSIFHWLVG